MYNCGTSAQQGSKHLHINTKMTKKDLVESALKFNTCRHITMRRLQSLCLTFGCIAAEQQLGRFCNARPCTCFVVMILVGMVLSASALFQSVRSMHQTIRMQQVMITTDIPPAAVQHSALYPSIHVSCSAREGTAISLAAACLTSVIAASAVMHVRFYSESNVSFRTELGRPPMCLMLNKSHNVVTRFPSRCFVKSAELTVPRIF